MDIDHIVLWVDDVSRSLDFYTNVLGLEAVREEEFRSGNASFPSVRLNKQSILDIMDRSVLLPLVQKSTGGDSDVGGTPINHICLSMSSEEYASISRCLQEGGIEIHPGGEHAFGAQGQAIRSAYFNDPDGNVLEMRHY